MPRSEFDSLLPEVGFSRRGFLVTSLGAGFALATQPIAAQTAIKTYPEVPTNEKALEMMVKGYDKLGLTDLRDDARKVLRLNYPGNPSLATAGQ